jgi:hypothetical protein
VYVSGLGFHIKHFPYGSLSGYRLSGQIRFRNIVLGRPDVDTALQVSSEPSCFFLLSQEQVAWRSMQTFVWSPL